MIIMEKIYTYSIILFPSTKVSLFLEDVQNQLSKFHFKTAGNELRILFWERWWILSELDVLFDHH